MRKPFGPGSEPGLTNEEIRRTMSKPEPFYPTPEQEERIERAIALADAELDARQDPEVRVNLRWSRGSLGVIRQAADLAGVPYQNWMKQVLYRAAVEEITAASAVDPRARRLTP